MKHEHLKKKKWLKLNKTKPQISVDGLFAELLLLFFGKILNLERAGDALYLPCGWWHAVVGSQDHRGFRLNAVWVRDAPWGWNIYLHLLLFFRPNVGKYPIHGKYGMNIDEHIS